MKELFGQPFEMHGGQQAKRRSGSLVRRVDGNVLEIAFRKVEPVPPAMVGQGWYHEAAIAADEQARAVRRGRRPLIN